MDSLFAAWALILLMNFVPVPMPPTWMVMVALHATVDLPLLALTIGGTAAAALGRAGFALQLRRSNRQLPPDMRANAEALAVVANRRLHWPTLFVVLYSLLPLSSNPVFMAVGLGALPLRSSVVAFFLARSVFNTAMVLGSKTVTSSVADLFTGRGT
jgi:hypothetical protein